MDEKWTNIFQNYIKDFHAIDLLQVHKIIDEHETLKLKNKLLVDIIVTMECEIKD